MTKDLFIGILFIAIVILLVLRKCGGKPAEIKETIKIDTVYKDVKADTFYIPQRFVTYLPGKVPKPLEKWDTLYLIEPTDTAAILQGYYSFNLYSDTVKVQDYGSAIISDTVSRNRVLGRGVKYNLKIPEVTKTITRTIIEKKNQFYVGAGMFGNPKEIAAGYEVNLSLKTKQDRIVEVGYIQEFNGIGYYKIGYKHKLSFKK